MKRFLTYKIPGRLLLIMYMMASISLFVTSKAKANIAQNRAFAGFINTVYLNVDAVNNGNHLCIFGVDEISLQLRSVVKREWLKNRRYCK